MAKIYDRCPKSGSHEFTKNYFERTLEPVLSHSPAGPTGAHGADEVRWLSPKPQAVDGAPAFSTRNGDHAGGEAGHKQQSTIEIEVAGGRKLRAGVDIDTGALKRIIAALETL